MIRVHRTASSCLPGVSSNPSPSTPTTAGAARTPISVIAPTITSTAPITAFASRIACSRPWLRSVSANVGTNAEESAPSANRSRSRLGMRKPTL